jgi:single-strand DNA-binding protein
MTDTITLTGIVGSDPRSVTTAEGLAITSFRLASNQRRYDRAQEKWIEGDTNWYTVSTFRQLAANAAVSINKGERVVVSGRLKVREYETGGKKNISVEIEADALGHDLSWGTAAFSRGAGAATTDAPSAASPVAPAQSRFPTAAELEAIVDGGPTPVADAPRTDVETPF